MAEQNNDNTQNLPNDLSNTEECHISVENQSPEEDNIASENAELIKQKEQNKALNEKMLRLAADMENLRRRTERDMQDARTYSIAQFARDMLSVSDNLERALKALPKSDQENNENLKALIQGIEMTQSSMISNLEKHGVKKLEPIGEKFDPNFHQAMFEIPSNDSPSNTVLEVVQSGFAIGNRVLRPALVGVAKNSQTSSQLDKNSDS